jgi:hypothetical protein
MEANSSPSQLWIGLRTDTELPNDLDQSSCLSPKIVQNIIRDYIPNAPSLCPTPWDQYCMNPQIRYVIENFLKRHPLFSIMHQLCIDHAIELMTTWYTYDSWQDPSKVITNRDLNDDEWNAYLATMISKRYKLSFHVENYNGQKCYHILGPRDTMMALFGWNAIVSDKNLNPPICLRSKISVECDDFIKMFEVTKKAEELSLATQS